ncbi:MAG: response regulator [Kiritimatiellae bacterium]|nr:response regulator [Kiritimatiellia bacterium]MDD5520067.1 response regulator [Kiritimatiellia bacterium]
MKILVLDDDLSIIKMLKEILQPNHTVDGITSAESAVELLKQKEYDLVFVDYDIPDHDGLWFMKNVKLPRKTIALLFTGNLTKAILLQMFKLGISGYLTKPVSIEQVQRNVEFYSHSGEYTHYAVTA